MTTRETHYVTQRGHANGEGGITWLDVGGNESIHLAVEHYKEISAKRPTNASWRLRLIQRDMMTTEAILEEKQFATE